MVRDVFLEGDDGMTDDNRVEDEMYEDEQTDGLIELKKEPRADDSAAVQAVVCIVIAAALIGINIFRPDLGGELIALLKELSSREGFIEDPIGMILRRWMG